MVKEFERDTTFKFPVNLVEHAALMSEDQIYAEFTGPDDSSERTLHSTKSQYVSGFIGSQSWSGVGVVADLKLHQLRFRRMFLRPSVAFG